MDIKQKKLFLFDIDGVIRLGDKIIDGAIDLFDHIKSVGGTSIFITNNSTKGESDYIDYFKDLGFDVDKNNFLTALTVSCAYLKKHHFNDKIFVMGTKSLVNELKKQGLNVTEDVEDGINVVLVGYDTEMTYQKIINVCKVLQTQNVTYLATNMDLICPVVYGFIPDCGGIVEFIKMATNLTPKFLGKPSPEMVISALDKTGFTKEQTIVIGDRLYTDIACGINAGVDTCAVLTGETNEKEIGESQYKPTVIYKSVKEIFEDMQK